MDQIVISAGSESLRALTDFLATRGITPTLIPTRTYGPESERASRWEQMTVDERKAYLTETFGTLNARIPEDYRFNRDELYDR
jgi:hypothetical protein